MLGVQKQRRLHETERRERGKRKREKERKEGEGEERDKRISQFNPLDKRAPQPM